MDAFNFGRTLPNLALIGTPWLVFTLALVALLVFLEFKSLCIPQHCRFLLGLLIPVLGIAVCGKFFGASAVLGAAFNAQKRVYLSVRFIFHFKTDSGEFHRPLGMFFRILASIQVHLLPGLPPFKHCLQCRHLSCKPVSAS